MQADLIRHRAIATDPLLIGNASLLRRAVLVFAAMILLAGASFVEVPMVPVPITGQTLAVTLVGALFGWRLGMLAVVLWLLCGALGLPVLAGGASGYERFVGPTGGYLFAFPIAAALVGWLAERGWNGHRPTLAFAAMVLGSLACLVIDAAWLSTIIGLEDAVLKGVIPFLLGGLIKSAIGAGVLWLLATQVNRPRTA